MNNIVFTTESPSDVLPEYQKKFNIGVVPLHVNLDGKDYYDDDPQITSQFIYNTYREKKVLPSTSSVSIAEYTDFFKKYLDEGKTIIHVALSSGISSTYQNACIAKADLNAGKRLFVIDSRSLSQAICVLLFKGAAMAEDGKEPMMIAAALQDMVPRLDKSFIITSLEFLRHGGRCSALEAFGANMLKLKPIIDMDADGKMFVPKKLRGKVPAVYLDYIDDRLSGTDYDDEYVFISKVLVPDDQVEAMVDHLKTNYHFKHVIVNETGCVICSHGGKGAAAVFFLKK